MDRTNLIVLDTAPGWEPGDVDALLINLRDEETPYIVARGFDAGTFSWSAGSYHRDLLSAMGDLHRTDYLEWAIAGCTPEDVVELYQDDFYVTDRDARRIANKVNERMGMRDYLFEVELDEEVRNSLVRRADATPEERRQFEIDNEYAEMKAESYFIASKDIRPGLKLETQKTLSPAELRRLAKEAVEKGTPDDGGGGPAAPRL